MGKVRSKQELLHHPAISNNGGCKAIAQNGLYNLK